MKKSIPYIGFMFILALSGPVLLAQHSTLKGYVYDSKSGQPVAYATVGVANTMLGATTDMEGYYHIAGVPAGSQLVEVRCMGYQSLSEEVELIAAGSMVRNYILEPATVDLQEVKVISAREDRKEQITISEIRILPAQIEQTPSIGGMPDVIQHIQMIPGVVSRGDIGGQIYIRGGTPVQTKFLLDEAIIYNPVHSIGLFTVFDNDYLRNIDLHTGGFGAQFGGAISSIIDLSTRYGNPQRFSGKVDLSTIGSKILLEGPLIKDSTMEGTNLSFMLSAKNSHLVQARDLFYSYMDQDLPFHFLDLYSKLTLLVGKSLRINLFGFNNRDRVGYEESPASYRWKSSGFGGDIQLMPARSSMTIKAYFAGSYYSMRLDEELYEPRFSDVNHLSFGFRFKRYLKNQTIDYGIEIMNLKTDYVFFSSASNSIDQMENSTELAAYLQYHARLGRFMVDPGLRFQHYATLGRSSLEPRLAVKFSVLDNLRLKMAAGLYSQNLISAISDRDIINFFHGFLSAPVEVVNDDHNDHSEYYLQKAQHYIAGVEAEFRNKLLLNIEVYYKYYPQLLNFNKMKIFDQVKHPEEPSYLTHDFIVESGFAEGVDISLLYDDQFRRFELGYSYAITKRSYDDPMQGRIEYFPQYDRRHNLNLSCVVRFGRFHLWEADARWNFGTGFPFTPTIGYFELVNFDENSKIDFLTTNGEVGLVYGQYNSSRLPVYHRLDISVQRIIKLGNRNLVEVEFTVTNLYNRDNIFYTNRRSNEQVYQLPVLPSLRVSLEF